MKPTHHYRPHLTVRSGLFLALLLALVLSQTGALAAPAFQDSTPTPEASATPLPPGDPALAPPAEADTDAAGALPGEATATATPPPADKDGLRAALQKAIGAQQEMALPYLLYRVDVDRIQYSKNKLTALVWLAFIDPDTNQPIATEPGLAIARRSSTLTKNWKMTLQVDPGWNAALKAVPAGLVSDKIRSEMTQSIEPEQIIAQAGTVYKGYKLPWKGGTTNSVSGSIGHVLTYKSCPATCMYAFDFADGTMFPVYAARSGRVRYAKWSYANGNTTNANYLILEDASTTPVTYQVYYHLAQDSIPPALRVVGAAVNQGQFIALADDTGYSTGHHLHFHVYTTPNSLWGTSVDISFDDVPINGGRPRTCAEARAYPQYGSECMPNNLLLSGNTTGPTPPKPTLLAPTGLQRTAAPTFQWSAIEGGLQYYLWINKAGATTAALSLLVNASACKEGTCSYTPTTGLVDGDYEFKMRTGSATGWSGWTSPMPFSTNSHPEVPVPVSPSGTIYMNSPAYTWTAVTGASQYYLMVYSDASASYIIYRTLLAANICNGETCSYVSTATLNHGSYKFKVRSGNAANVWSDYSPFMPFFSYLAPLPPKIIDPVPEVKVTNPRPKYTWATSAGATKYGIQVYSLTTKATVATYAVASTYLCSTESCSYRPSLNLAAGQYQYRVRGYNGYGWGSYSPWQPFTVQLVPDPPELVSPGGTISINSPAYTWKVVPGATTYYLMVYSNAEAAYIIYRTLYPANVCRADGTCSYTSTARVVNGRSYKFKVRSYNSYGWGLFSPWKEFNVQP